MYMMATISNAEHVDWPGEAPSTVIYLVVARKLNKKETLENKR